MALSPDATTEHELMVLSSPRREQIEECLAQAGGAMALSDLSRCVAAAESTADSTSDHSPDAKRVQDSLKRVDLPVLHRYQIVEYDPAHEMVSRFASDDSTSRGKRLRFGLYSLMGLSLTGLSLTHAVIMVPATEAMIWMATLVGVLVLWIGPVDRMQRGGSLLALAPIAHASDIFYLRMRNVLGNGQQRDKKNADEPRDGPNDIG